MNRTWLGVGCLAGVLLWFATDQIILLIVGVLLGVAVGIGVASQNEE